MKVPIAIVGRGTVLPGALSPDALWRAVVDGREMLKTIPDGAWPVPPHRVGRPQAPGQPASGPTPFRSGFVEGFEAVFDAQSYALPAEEVMALDRATQWLIHAAQQAVAELARPDLSGERAAIVIGNLSYPTRNMTDLAYAATVGGALPGARPLPEQQWLHRFVSGRPAHVLAQSLGVTGPAFCLDAACASSLYAVKHACDYLLDGTADVVLAGAVNGCDNIYLHRGFAEIGALSRTARSRPFSKQADGLLPAEGAAALVLKRLDDAIRDGDPVHAVIRGVGLSNDGRSRGLLAPDPGGQLRAIEAAYQGTGLDPSMLSLMECHATGTPVGDRTEVESVIRAVGDIQDLPVGSLKSNLGHLVSVAGIAGIIKVVGAMDAGIRPATLNAEDRIPAFENSPLRPLLQNEAWPDDGPRRAGINNFGFGGNNAHLILEQFIPQRTPHRVPATATEEPAGDLQQGLDDDIVICGIGLIHGNERGLDAFAEKLTGASRPGSEARTDAAVLPLKGLGFPPNDLKQCLGQQTLALEAGLQAVTDVELPDSDRCGVIIGMGADFDASRIGVVWRTEQSLHDLQAGDEVTQAVRAAIGGLTGPAYVMGAMPNLPANRINVQLDMRGLGFTVSSEELSGLTALDIGIRALRRKELDLVLAGAADLSTEALHRKACAAIPEIGERNHADGAVVFALKRRADAERCGDPIISVVDVGPMESRRQSDTSPGNACPFGQPHAASALFELAAALATGLKNRAEPASETGMDDRALAVTARSFTGCVQSAYLHPLDVQPAAVHDSEAPHLEFAAAETAAQLAEMLRSDRRSCEGRLRIAITARTAEQLAQRVNWAIDQLEAGRTPEGPGIEFGAKEFHGDVGFIFPGLGAAYPGVLRQSLKLFPEVRDRFERIHGAEAFERAAKLLEATAHDQITLAEFSTVGAAASNFNDILAKSVLGLRPDACLGVSMGEVSMLFAQGVWRDPDAITEGLERAGFYANIAGGLPLPADDLGLDAGERGTWENFEVFGPVDELRQEIERTEHVWLLIIASPDRCLIGGVGDACAALVSRLPDSLRAMPLPMSFAFHGPFAARFSDDFHKQVSKPIARNSGDIRYYFNATNRSAALSSDTIAELLTLQGIQTVDFPATVLQAWNDGVRAFIDIGPRSALARSVHSVLGERPHIAVGLDVKRRDDLSQLTDACAKLFAYGLPVSIEGHKRRLDRMRRVERPASDRTISFPAHLPAIDVRDEMLGEIGNRRKEVDPAPRDVPLPHAMPQPPSLPKSADVIPIAEHLHRTQADAEQRALSESVMVHRYEELDEANLALTARGESGGAAAARPATRMPLPPGWPRPVEHTHLQSVPPASPARGRREPAPGMTRRVPVLKPIERLRPSGLTLDRAALEFASRGRISEVFGEMFAPLDGYRRQCRMPAPPLLLADRVTGIQGEPGSMGKGVCWTETDVRPDSWYLHDDRMPVGVVIEAGQADLLLISWLGADFLNRGERVYRLLGCEITFHDGDLPKVGDTIEYQIHIDAHASVGDTRLFFFRYDAHVGDRLLSSVRHGQAGFFTDAELAGSDGVLWSPEDDAPKPDARFDPGPATSVKRSFSSAEVQAFAEGDAFACFGTGFEFAAAHQRTPKIPAGRMQLIDRVPVFDPAGGPWGRGYLRAEYDVPTDSWFYDGHFHNDPCMPGTLMVEGAVQALKFHMAALGFTIERDGWRFQPATGEPFKFDCRGQVVPDKAHHITYEVFIEEVVGGERPKVYAALIAKSDGFKVFLCRRFGVTLVRDWPLYSRRIPMDAKPEGRIVPPSRDVPGDFASLLASAWGKPSDSFGSMYRELDADGSPPRLPGPPYLFISRILSVDCPPGQVTAGGKLISEYDVPADAWYFADGGSGAMPFSVLSEVALQPCGWLASYMGLALGKHVKFRNLNGRDCTVHCEVWPDTGTVTTEITFLKSAQVGPMTIVFFEIDCRIGNTTIIRLSTDFGFFPPEALAQQKGLPASDAQRAALQASPEAMPADRGKAALAAEQAPRLPSGMLDLVDGITRYWPDGGKAGLGRAVGQQRVDPSAWYFKAHFFTDPVQAGSLGLEALYTLLKAVVKMKNLHQRFKAPRFESPALGQALVWAYRGQVVPANKQVSTEIVIVEILDEGGSYLVRAAGSLWVDGLRIYEVKDYCLRIKESERQQKSAGGAGSGVVRIDPEAEPWLLGHKPTFVVPAYPMLGVAGLLLNNAGADSAAAPVVRIDMLEIRGWLLLNAGPLDLEFRRTPLSDGRERVAFHRLRDGLAEKRPAGVAMTSQDAGAARPEAWQPLEGGEVEADPYGNGGLFHDGAFQVVDSIRWGADRSSFDVDVAEAREPAGGDPTILLDALFHGFPHYAPERWYGEAAAGHSAFPYRLEHFTLYEPLPQSGRVTVMTRGRDMPTARTVCFDVQVQCEGRVVADATMIEALVPTEVYRRRSPAEFRRYCQYRVPVPEFHLSSLSPNRTRLTVAELKAANWLPGTFQAIYGLPPEVGEDPRLMVEYIAVKDHFAAKYAIHPAEVRIEGGNLRPGANPPVALSMLTRKWVDPSTFEVRDIIRSEE